MNIYLVRWLHLGHFGLVATVIAHDEDEALDEIELDYELDSAIVAEKIGVCTNGAKLPCVVCCEGL